MVNVKNKRYLEIESGTVHFNVYKEFLNSNDDAENEIAKILNELRSIRNNADYDDEFSIDFFKLFLNDKEKDFEIAFEALQHLWKLQWKCFKMLLKKKLEKLNLPFAHFFWNLI